MKYLVKSEIGGISIQLIESPYALAVIYGMEKTEFDINAKRKAFVYYKGCLAHALECGGWYDE